jgi:two-component system NtrC family sensor kinase
VKQDSEAGIGQTVAELEQRLQTVLAERDELLQQQTATAEILKLINASPGDLAPVFDIILEKAHSLCDVSSGSLQLYDGDDVRTVAVRGFNERWEQYLRRGYKINDAIRRGFETVHPRHIADMRDAVERSPDNPIARAFVEIGGFRTFLGLPLVKDGKAIGRIVAAREEVRPFTDHQIALLQSFADQAVVAIENARLLNETREALERQTATADILKVIASSPDDVQPVFDVIVESAVRLCGARMGRVYRYEDGIIQMVAGHGLSAPGRGKVQQVFPRPANDDTIAGQVMRSHRPYFVTDIERDQSVPVLSRQMIEALGTRSQVTVPMLRSGEPIGAITVGWADPDAYGDQQVRLLETFADQAVIAIENARLFNETKEALEQQTATAEILKVIASSPNDVQPVLEAVADRAMSLLNCWSVIVGLFDGEQMHFGAARGALPDTEEHLRKLYPARPDPETNQGRCILERAAINVADLQADASPRNRERARMRGFRAGLVVPMLRDGQPVGTISVSRREAGAFAANEVQLLQTFADQAVIAIQNARLFNETREALEQQTATSEVLQIISRSAFDLDTVLQTLVEIAAKLCRADTAQIYRREGEVYRSAAMCGEVKEAYRAIEESGVINPGRGTLIGRVALAARLVQIADAWDDPEYGAKEDARIGNLRSMLGVPLLRGGELVGAFALARDHVEPFSSREIDLVRTFADQAVIAIENVRLFNETREALERQTATSEVRKVISASPGELEPVFQAMLANAVRLCEAKFAMLFLYQDNEFRGVEKWNLPAAFSEFLGKNPIRADPMIPLGRVAITKQPVQVADVLADQSYIEGYPGMVGVAELGGARTLLQVPLLKENELVGTIGIYRQEVRPFNDKQIALLQNFASQAVIAIDNTRLLNELRQRTTDLSKSLEDLQTAQDRLVQTEKLASLGQLTAGIAHEIKNPLNFVNNFSALSAELIDELDDALAPAALDHKTRSDISELTGMLKSNLEKVVQHGKRADSIVKNMLLHSREGSGEHRPADINAIVEESLNLAYHGARAEKSGFNITLRRDLDPEAGMIELYPQEITRVLLNLISNGFYAATKRKAEAGDEFEPVLSATTRNHGNRVEIRIRDNGTGIPLEVKEKMFNPFFTTKPAGEGTGLGLSMSHDIVVKQHGGKIDVDTEPGVFTEFIITLPRNAAAQPDIGGKN